MSDKNQETQQTDNQRDWQARVVSTDCSHCVFFQRRGSSKFGTCSCAESYFNGKQVFQDSNCAKFFSLY